MALEGQSVAGLPLKAGVTAGTNLASMLNREHENGHRLILDPAATLRAAS